MLRATAMAALAACVIYGMAIALWAPDIRSGQDQQADIAIAVEHFLYGPPVEAAIVGSSQAERFSRSVLGPGIANLAFAGEGPLVGLTLVARSGRSPRWIYVEMNNIAQPVDHAFVDAAFTEPGYTLKRFIKALRTAYQPVNIAIALARRAARGRDEVYYPAVVDPPLHETLLARQQNLLGTPPNPDGLTANLAELKRLAALFAAQQTRLVLFEMPIDPRLENAPAVVAVRRAAHAAFPGNAFCWNAAEPPRGLPAMDGIHLDTDTAAGFWKELAATDCQPHSAKLPGALEKNRENHG